MHPGGCSSGQTPVLGTIGTIYVNEVAPPGWAWVEVAAWCLSQARGSCRGNGRDGRRDAGHLGIGVVRPASCVAAPPPLRFLTSESFCFQYLFCLLASLPGECTYDDEEGRMG